MSDESIDATFAIRSSGGVDLELSVRAPLASNDFTYFATSSFPMTPYKSLDYFFLSAQETKKKQLKSKNIIGCVSLFIMVFL